MSTYQETGSVLSRVRRANWNVGSEEVMVTSDVRDTHKAYRAHAIV